MKRTLLEIFAWLFILSTSCDSPKKSPSVFSIPHGTVIIADTVTYDIILRVFDTTDIWDVAYHKHIKHELFVDHIFEGIYQNYYLPFDYYTGKALSLRDIKRIEKEKGFSRQKVTKLQVKDLWLIDSCGVFRRIPYSYTLGIELISKHNTFLGHKVLFTVKPSYPLVNE